VVRELVLLGGGRDVVVRELVLLGGGRDVVVRELVLLGGGRDVVVRELVLLGGGRDVVVRELVLLGGGRDVVVRVRELLVGGRDVEVRVRELVVGGRDVVVRVREFVVGGRDVVVRVRVLVLLEPVRVLSVLLRELVLAVDELDPTLRPVYRRISSFPTALAVSRSRLVPLLAGGVLLIFESPTVGLSVRVVVRSVFPVVVRASPTSVLVLVSVPARVRESRRVLSSVPSATVTAALSAAVPIGLRASRRSVTPRRRSAGRRA